MGALLNNNNYSNICFKWDIKANNLHTDLQYLFEFFKNNFPCNSYWNDIETVQNCFNPLSNSLQNKIAICG